jgi:hypothetical protein
MFANYRNVQNTDHSSRTYVDTICGVDIHITKPGPPDSKPCREARYRLRQADMSVCLNARNEGAPPEKRRNSDTVSTDEERKAMVWFSVSEKIRQQDLLDLAGAEYTAYDERRGLEVGASL